LRFANAEGGGLHICGGSSTGKTSIAAVAGSICGSDGQKGYMYQWRMTDNSLERIAALHNDNFLVLDEISQATSETVYEVTYMLTNGQGKFRSKSDSTPKQAYKWMLNYLSTGEITIDAKIKENPRNNPLAGQAVRVIDLPIDKGRNAPTFSQIHNSKDSADFSNIIRQKSLKYYGTPLREFIRKIVENYHYVEHSIEKIIENFTTSLCDMDAEGQVRRVAQKFGLIAAAGELAIEFGILPYQKNDALNAAAEWFRVWIEQRGSSTNLEITTQIQILKDHFDRYGETNYLDLSYSRTMNNKLCGYKFRDNNGCYRYLMIMPQFNELFSRYNKRQVLDLFAKRGFLELDKDGEPKRFKKLAGITRRGYIFIPQNWADPVESEDDEKSPF
jgi:uncharacterized protein (DUF927 family)